MSEFNRADLNSIARELGYQDWQHVPPAVRRNVRACDRLPETAARVDDWLVDALEGL